jgi:hypothetical protein
MTENPVQSDLGTLHDSLQAGELSGTSMLCCDVLMQRINLNPELHANLLDPT